MPGAGCGDKQATTFAALRTGIDYARVPAGILRGNNAGTAATARRHASCVLSRAARCRIIGYIAAAP